MSSSATLDWKGKKIGVYSFSDHYSYWAADATRPGINFIDVDHHTPHDIAMIKQRIQKDREQKMFDLVVVSIHWGESFSANKQSENLKVLIMLGTLQSHSKRLLIH
jgi:hypothetical protein